MPPLPSPPFRIDLWTAPAPAGGTRVAFLVDPGGRAARNVVRTRHVQPGRSELSYEVAPDYSALAELAPQARIVRLTRFVPTAPDAYAEVIEEYRILRRQRVVRDAVGVYGIGCVPLEEDLLDMDLFRTVGSGGLASWRYGAVDRTPAEILQDLVDRAVDVGIAWVAVGTVTPSTPVTIDLPKPTLRAIIDATIAALAAKGVVCEFQLRLASDLSSYLLELVTQVGGSLAPLVVTTGQNAIELGYDEDALEQVTKVIPFGVSEIDLREFQFASGPVNGGTGDIDVLAIDGTTPVIVAFDDQFTGKRLFRELTGRSFAITGCTASPQRIRIAVADLASGIAAGERFSFRDTEDNAGTRRFVTQLAGEVPVQVASTLTAPNRIRTTTHTGLGAGNWLGAANHLRDWTAERSQFVEELDGGTLNEAAGTFVLDSSPVATPTVGDWILFHAFAFATGDFFYASPITVLGWTGGTRTISFTRRYPHAQLGLPSSLILAGAYLYRPVGTPMTILGSAVPNNELTVDALPGPAFAATDVLEIWQRCQGTRLVELVDPAGLAAGRAKVGQVDVPDCSGATNRVVNGELVGASADPDGFTVANVVGTVIRTRITAAEYTRYGGRSWRIDFAAGASADLRSPLIPIHCVPGAETVAAAVAMLFTRHAGPVPLVVTLYAVSPSGVRTALKDPVRVYPPDTTVKVDAAFKAAIEQWYDAKLTDRRIDTLRDEVLQLEVSRPSGATNPPCTVYLDAFQLLQREGLVQSLDGGVQYEFGSRAVRMVAAGNDVLLERSRPLVRYRARLLAAPGDATIGRTIALRVPPMALSATLRLVSTREELDRLFTVSAAEFYGEVEAEFERYRPDVARLLAQDTLRLLPPAPPIHAPTSAPPWLDVSVHAYDANTDLVVWAGGPTVTLRIDGGIAAAPPTSPITVPKHPSTGAAKDYLFTASNGIPAEDAHQRVLVQAKAYVPAGTPSITAVSPTIMAAPGDGGGSFDLAITVANMPGTETYEGLAEVVAGNPISTGFYPFTGKVIGDFPLLAITGCAMAPGAQLQVRVDAVVAGAVIATKTVTVFAT